MHRAASATQLHLYIQSRSTLKCARNLSAWALTPSLSRTWQASAHLRKLMISSRLSRVQTSKYLSSSTHTTQQAWVLWLSLRLLKQVLTESTALSPQWQAAHHSPLLRQWLTHLSSSAMTQVLIWTSSRRSLITSYP